MKNKLYEIVCCNSGKIIEYQYMGKRVKDKPKIEYNTTIEQSHGYCKGCAISMYNSLGLIFDYNNKRN